MSKAVMVSIQPKWCELIASGKKTIEVRKTKPKIETPFKCYIYCTKPIRFYKISECMCTSYEYLHLCEGKVTMGDGFELYDKDYQVLNGKVIGEFVCDCISEYECEFHDGICMYYEEISKVYIDEDGCEYRRIETANDNDNPDNCYLLRNAAMTFQQIKDYANWDGFGILYGWHISELKIYDTPKDLSEFYTECDMGCEDCDYWKSVRVNADEFDMDCDSGMHGHKPIKRAPQSWRYVDSCCCAW